MHCSLDGPHTPASGIRPQDARSLGHLSSLTALTQLQLICPHYERCDATWSEAEGTDREQRRWQDLWPAQREALVAALRHMPHLASFKSSSLTLSVSDLAALTSLTNVQLAGLAPPGPTEQEQQPAASGLGTAAGGPHQLLGLWLGGGPCSPRALACLGTFPRLRAVITSESRRVVMLPFGPADAVPGGSHLLPDTPQVMRQAVGALADVRARGGMDDNAWHSKYGKGHVLCINADAGPMLLFPPPVVTGLGLVSLTGHAPWLRELRALAVPGQRVELWGLALAAGDLACVADTFPDGKVRKGVPAWCRRFAVPYRSVAHHVLTPDGAGGPYRVTSKPLRQCTMTCNLRLPLTFQVPDFCLEIISHSGSGLSVSRLQVLDVKGSSVELGELVCLGQMRQLQRLALDTTQCEWESDDVLMTALHAACLGCLHLRKLELVCELDYMDHLCGEVWRALADSGRGDVQVKGCFE